MNIPPFPNTGYCCWSYNPESRVLHADFRQQSWLPHPPVVMPADEIYLLEMMERDDITVISEGLADEISASLWTREYIVGCIGSEYHHKIRAFRKKTRPVAVADTTNEQTTATTTIEYHEEESGWYSMKFSSYFDYLEKRRNIQEKGGDENSGNNRMFSFKDCNGKEHSIDAEAVSLVSC